MMAPVLFITMRTMPVVTQYEIVVASRKMTSSTLKLSTGRRAAYPPAKRPGRAVATRS